MLNSVRHFDKSGYGKPEILLKVNRSLEGGDR